MRILPRMKRTLLALALASAVAACGDDDPIAADTAQPDLADTVAPDTTPPQPDTADTAAPDTEPALDTTPDTTPDTTSDTAPEVEVTPACVDRPVPFPLPTEPEPWNHLSSEAVTQLGVDNHRGQDVIVQVGNPQVLVAKFAYAFVDKDMLCEDVDVWVQREVPCGAWEWLGQARTSDNPDDSTDCTNHGTQYGIEDDGGRVFFEISDTQALPVGRYPIRMVLRGDLTLASFDLIVVAPGTQAIVTDIDGTLTTGDDQLITEVALAIFNETYTQEMYVDADAMIRSWYDKGYLVLYMSGRPDMLRAMTERWVEPRFPPGPLHLTDTNAQVVPNNDGVGVYKREYLAYLRAQGIDIVAAYGNATTDIWAYAQSGIPKEVTFIIGKHAGEENTVPLSGSYTAHLPTARAFPEATIKAPPALHGWW